MKILAIISSPRRKNTFNTIKTIEEIHKQKHDCEYEYLFLSQVDLQNCIGCHLCLTKGEEFCPLKDDHDMIRDKIESADGVILASPNHVMNVNWRMKNFIDRFAYTLHRPRYFDQRFMVLITSGSIQGVKQASNALATMASGGEIISKISVMNSPGMNEQKIANQTKQLRKEATKFVDKMSQPYNYKPSFGHLAWFSAFKAMYSQDVDESFSDYRYYSTREYFVDTDLSSTQKLVLKMFQGIFNIMIQRGWM